MHILFEVFLVTYGIRDGTTYILEVAVEPLNKNFSITPSVILYILLYELVFEPPDFIYKSW